MMVKKKVLFLLMVALIGQFIGYAQDHTEKTAKELLMSKEWRNDNHIIVRKFVNDTIYYRILPKPYLLDMPCVYYLSDVFIKEFDVEKIGALLNGKYLYVKGTRLEDFSVYEIKELSEERVILHEVYDSDDPDGTKIYIGGKIKETVYVPYVEK